MSSIFLPRKKKEEVLDVEQQVISLLESIRNGLHLTLQKEQDLMGEVSYEQHLYYFADCDAYYIQTIDWADYQLYSFRKGVRYAKISETEANYEIRCYIDSRETDA